MEPAAPPESVSILANAKVNLFLRVGGLRPDGYHDIETIYHSISLADTVSAKRAPRGCSVTSDDPALPRGSDNLAVRAACALLAEAGYDTNSAGVEIEIRKRIPVAAGLGGGSADAAGALAAVDRLYGLGRPASSLEELARKLGADVGFMLRGGCAIGRGRGDELEDLPCLPPLPLLVVVPDVTISTAWAYASLKMKLTTPGTRLSMVAGAVRAGDVAGVAKLLTNDFETLVFERFPAVKKIKEKLLDSGASGALMSGSGSAVYGVFLKAGDAQASGEDLARQGLTVLNASFAARGIATAR